MRPATRYRKRIVPEDYRLIRFTPPEAFPMRELSFLGHFKTADPQHDNFLARLLGLFSEEPVRIWCRDSRSPYEDLGRPTLRRVDETTPKTLDFTLRSRKDQRIYVAEMKCEITFENYRSLTLTGCSQLERHERNSGAFKMFLEAARNPGQFQVTVDKKAVAISGALLVWGACTPEGRKDVMEGAGIADVLSLESIIASLIESKNAEYTVFIEKRKRWCSELFDFLSDRR